MVTTQIKIECNILEIKKVFLNALLERQLR